MPIFSLPALENGRQIDSNSFLGKLVYVDFWASWCGPCVHSLPVLNRIHADYQGREFVVLAINVDEEPEDARRFLRKMHVDYLVLSDPAGDVARQFDLPAMPTSYLVDREGKVVWMHVGYKKKDEATIRAHIEAAL